MQIHIPPKQESKKTKEATTTSTAAMKLLGGPSLALLGGRIPCQNLRHRLLPTGLAQTILARMVPMIHGIGTNPGEVTLPRWEEFALVNKEVLLQPEHILG